MVEQRLGMLRGGGGIGIGTRGGQDHRAVAHLVGHRLSLLYRGLRRPEHRVALVRLAHLHGILGGKAVDLLHSSLLACVGMGPADPPEPADIGGIGLEKIPLSHSKRLEVRVLPHVLLFLLLSNDPVRIDQVVDVGVHNVIRIQKGIAGIAHARKRDHGISQRHLIGLALLEVFKLFLGKFHAVSAVGRLPDIDPQVIGDIQRVHHGKIVLPKLRGGALLSGQLPNLLSDLDAFGNAGEHQLAAALSQGVVGKVGLRLLLRLLLRYSVRDQLPLLFLDIGGAVLRILIHQPQNLAVAGIGLTGRFVVEQCAALARDIRPVAQVGFFKPGGPDRVFDHALAHAIGQGAPPIYLYTGIFRRPAPLVRNGGVRLDHPQKISVGQRRHKHPVDVVVQPPADLRFGDAGLLADSSGNKGKKFLCWFHNKRLSIKIGCCSRAPEGAFPLRILYRAY